MPPSSPEQNNLNENLVEVKPYLDIERTDSFAPSTNSVNNDDNNNSSTNTSNSTKTQISTQAAQKTIDPVELVKSMISSGFTPTKAQISNANNDLTGPKDSSNTWFAIFLKKIIDQNKKRHQG